MDKGKGKEKMKRVKELNNKSGRNAIK